MRILNFPTLVFVLSFVLLWLSMRAGGFVRKVRGALEQHDREDYDIVLTATLTLLGLIIGFTFSMATSRYDQRKNYEQEEANAIGTEYLRADLLPGDKAARVRELLRKYLALRVLFYTTHNRQQIGQINTDTEQLQAEMWSTVQAVAAAQRTPTVTLAASGMNDVLDSQGRTQAAWWNRIPVSAWILMAVIAISCNLLIGYGARGTRAGLLLVLPLLVSISFFLIADIDSPRWGVIRVRPENLLSLSHSLHTRD
jgi:hypothetical protein